MQDTQHLQSESQFRLVWETSGDGMRLTNRDGMVLRVNDAYCRMVQKSRAELEGQLLTVVHSEANADFVLSTYQKTGGLEYPGAPPGNGSHLMERRQGLV